AVPRVHELHAQQEPAATHLSYDHGALERRLELVAEPRSAFADSFHQAPFDQKVDHRQADGAGYRGAVPGVPEVESARASIDRVVDLLRAEDSSERRVSRAEALPDGHDVGLD